ncbi:MAG: hypothetical protein HY289_02055 [Planctomycetes bacterium]|nr:hypothetical protein [Planctomycetota bacterium]
MYNLTQADRIWNRACGESPLRSLPGDRALADLLWAHGLAMNGGVLHAVECLAPTELRDAECGYRFYGLDAVAVLLSRASKLLKIGDDLGLHERQLDQEYADLFPNEDLLVERFNKHLKENPTQYAPLRTRDLA